MLAAKSEDRSACWSLYSEAQDLMIGIPDIRISKEHLMYIMEIMYSRVPAVLPRPDTGLSECTSWEACSFAWEKMFIIYILRVEKKNLVEAEVNLEQFGIISSRSIVLAL